MKSPLPIIIGWIAGSLVSAFIMCCLALSDEVLSIDNMPPISEIFTGMAFWTVGVSVAMIPGVIIGTILYYWTRLFRGARSWIWAGLIGALVMLGWAVAFGFAGDILDEFMNTFFLTGGAFISASLFWYLTIKLEKTQNKPIQPTSLTLGD